MIADWDPLRGTKGGGRHDRKFRLVGHLVLHLGCPSGWESGWESGWGWYSHQANIDTYLGVSEIAES
jgi:hypothetical protein